MIIHLLIMQKSSQRLQLYFGLWGGARGKNQLILAPAEKLNNLYQKFLCKVFRCSYLGLFKASLKSSGNNLVPFVLIKLGVFMVWEHQALTPLPRGVTCFGLMEADPDEQTLTIRNQKLSWVNLCLFPLQKEYSLMHSSVTKSMKH